jgi:heterotetrameric sarcosine oxidase delta subunit
MRIPCPYCGERDLEEFSIQGEAAGPRPQASDFGDSDIQAFHAYVHLRANEFGPTKEFWYHAAGCRRWLMLSRDTRDHTILSVELAKP